MINSRISIKKTQSRKSIVLSTISLFLASIVFPPAFCQAQSAQPTLLAPSKNLRPLSDNKLPNAQSRPPGVPEWMQAQPLNLPPSDSVRTPIKINIEELEKIDSDSVGTLTEEEGGFGFNMWNGTRRSLVKKLLIKLKGLFWTVM